MSEKSIYTKFEELSDKKKISVLVDAVEVMQLCNDDGKMTVIDAVERAYKNKYEAN